MSSTSKYQKDILTDDENYHGTQYIKRVFFVFTCADIQFLKNLSPKALKLAQNANFSISSLFCPPFCYHSNGKSKIKVRILHLGYSSDKPIG